MAVRQYIGARYVPKFFENPNGSAEWMSGVPYEALTVVTYLGNSYTSRKPVPVGIDVLNTEYWVVTGNFNAQLNDVKEDVEEVDKKVDEGVEENLATMRTKTQYKRYIFIGDSYGHASGTNGWIDKLIPMLGLERGDYYDSGVGGGNFMDGSFLTQLQSINVDDPDSITDIVVLGGANERGALVETIAAGIASFESYVFNTFKNAVIYIGFIGGTNDISVRDQHYNRGIAAYTQGRHVFLNNLQYVLYKTSLIGPDGVHPTDEGYNVLARHIYGALMGGTSVEYYQASLTETIIEPVSGGAITENPQSIIKLNNNISTFSTRGVLRVSFDPGKNFQIFQNVTLARLNSQILIGGLFNDSFVPITIAVTSGTNNTQYMLDGIIGVQGNNIIFINNDPVATGSTSAFQNIVSVIVPAFSVKQLNL